MGCHLRIEEEIRANNGDDQANISSNVHMLEEGKESKTPHPKNNQKRKFDSKNKSHKKRKGSCHYCGKPGHFKKECRLLKKKNNKDDSANFMAMISEVYAIEDGNEWWIDSGATRHICKTKIFSLLMKPLKMTKFCIWGILLPHLSKEEEM